MRSSGAGQGEFVNTVRLKDGQGNAVPQTSYYRLLASGAKTDGVNANFAPYSVKPGESYTETILLNKLFSISAPGNYEVQVLQLDPLSKMVMKSNAVTVTVGR